MDARPSIESGWYPHHPGTLARTIEGFLSHVPTRPPGGRILGLVVPHAGYDYSGQVAASAFACLLGTHPQVVAVLSPMHRPVPADFLTTSHEAYETPLGTIPVDQSVLYRLGEMLLERAGVRLRTVRNDGEHAIEVELPFLQYVTGGFTLLPIMIRTLEPEALEALGHALAEVHPDLVVASSDLSHFYTQAEADRLDHAFLERLEAFDPLGVLRAEEEGAGMACGVGAIAAALWACRDLGASRATVLAYGTSGDVTHHYDSVVGYAAGVLS